LNVIEQLPAATVPVHVSPVDAVTVTLPVGVPEPGAFAVTV
jgi:hypothetical protein